MSWCYLPSKGNHLHASDQVQSCTLHHQQYKKSTNTQILIAGSSGNAHPTSTQPPVPEHSHFAPSPQIPCTVPGQPTWPCLSTRIPPTPPPCPDPPSPATPPLPATPPAPAPGPCQVPLAASSPPAPSRLPRSPRAWLPSPLLCLLINISLHPLLSGPGYNYNSCQYCIKHTFLIFHIIRVISNII